MLAQMEVSRTRNFALSHPKLHIEHSPRFLQAKIGHHLLNLNRMSNQLKAKKKCALHKLSCAPISKPELKKVRKIV